MGMFSEIGTEVDIGRFVGQIKAELAQTSNQEIAIVLKRLGRWALTQFDWDAPAWAKEYDELFKE